jgi:lipopolysaccharide biosynthesis glycosyltransferase
MKFTFTVKKKTIESFPLTERLDELFGDNPKIKFPEDYGVLTASNWKHFPCLQFLLYSLVKKYEVPICVFDLGMTKNQLEWCKQIPNLEIVSSFVTDFNHMEYWEAWAKPYYIKNSPFKKSLWIDSDTIVSGNLLDIVEIADDKPLFTADHTGVNERTYNHEDLYKLMPIKGMNKDKGAYLNTGVYLLDSERDKELITQWLYCVEQAGKDSDIAKAVTCWDQGACRWALQKLDLMGTINHTKIFNYPAKFRQIVFAATPTALNVFLDTIKHAVYDNITVYHWMGSPKPWTKWPEILPIHPFAK